MTALMETNITAKKAKRGKVRDIYSLGDDKIIIVTTDRISAFDVVMSSGIPDKGKVLTAITQFWLNQLWSEAMPNHLISTKLEDLPEPFQQEELEGRIMLCRKVKPLPIECIVRGYITGSGWVDYQKTGKVCGIKLPPGLKECAKLPEPIFTPSTKADSGHDQNIPINDVVQSIGQSMASTVKQWSLRLYKIAHTFALKRGIIIADTKFEFGVWNNRPILIDEVLTPDSSRFWPKDQYEEGRGQPSFDKQFVRDFLQGLCDAGQWDKKPPGLMLPPNIIEETIEKYLQIHKMLTGRELV